MTQPYYGDDGTFTITDNAATPSNIPAAGLKGVTVELEAEHIQLFTSDSIEREAVKKRELEIPVEIEFALWDEQLVQAWMAGDSTTTATSVTDTSDVAEFRLESTVTSTDSNKTIELAVEDVFIENMPAWDLQEGEFITQNISGTGSTISNLSVV